MEHYIIFMLHVVGALAAYKVFEKVISKYI